MVVQNDKIDLSSATQISKFLYTAFDLPGLKQIERVMLQLSPYTSCPIPFYAVPTLNHEIFDYTVKWAILMMISVGAGSIATCQS